MSVVTTVVVASSYLPIEDVVYLRAFKWGDESPGRVASFNEAKSCEHFGGSKCGEGDVLLGAFNYFDTKGFIEYLKKRHFYSGITAWMEWNGGITTVYIQEAKANPSGIHVIWFPTS